MSSLRILAVALLLLITSNPLLAQKTSGSSAEVVATLRGHTKSISQIEFSHSGEIVASSSNDGTVRLWRTATGESLATIAGHKNSEVYELDWTSDDRRLAITYYGKSWGLVVWDVPTERSIIRQRFPDTSFLECSPDGQTFLTLDGELKLHIWDVNTGQLNHTLTPALVSNESYTVSFVADGKRILTAAETGPIELWDVATGKLIDTYPANTIPNAN